MHSNDTTLNAISSVSVNAMKNNYGISSFISEGSTDYLYLEAYLALDILLKQDGAREKYNAAMMFNEEGVAAACDEAKYIECADVHIKESRNKIEKLEAILFPLKEELEKYLLAGKEQLPEHIKKKFVEIQQLESSIAAHNRASRYALDMRNDAEDEAKSAFDKRDIILSDMPDLFDALTTMELLRPQVSNEVISIAEKDAYH